MKPTPCPYCRDALVGVCYHRGLVYCECYTCKRKGPEKPTRDEAVSAWNAGERMLLPPVDKCGGDVV